MSGEAVVAELPAAVVRLVAVNVASFDPSAEAFESALAMLQPESVERIRRFRRRQDAIRCLMGRLIPLYALQEEGIAVTLPVHTARSPHGRPYFDSPLGRTIDYNVSHDSSFVVGAWCAVSGDEDGLCHVGVDVMRLGLPAAFPDYSTLYESLSDQLAPSERQQLSVLASENDRTAHLLRLWAFKEALSKLLGLGAAIDFSTLAFDLDPFRPAPSVAARLKSTSPILLPNEARGIRFWEGRLEAEQDRYGVVVALRGQGADGSEAAVSVRTVSAEDILANARTLCQTNE